VADERGVAIQLGKVESLSEIMKHKVMRPAVVVDNIVVHTGGIPSRDIIELALTLQAGKYPVRSLPEISSLISVEDSRQPLLMKVQTQR
jgi:hypothetical protein